MEACWKPGKSQRKLMRKIAQRRTLGMSMASEWLSFSERRRRQRRLRRARKARSGWTAAGAAFLLQTPCAGSRVAATQIQALPRPLPPLAGRWGEEGRAALRGWGGRRVVRAGGVECVCGGCALGWWRGAAPPRDACEVRAGCAPRGPERCLGEREPRAAVPGLGSQCPQAAPGEGWQGRRRPSFSSCATDLQSPPAPRTFRGVRGEAIQGPGEPQRRRLLAQRGCCCRRLHPGSQ